MNNFTKNTALLLFVNTPHEETRGKELILHDKKSNEKLFGFLNNRVKQLAEKSNLPYFIIDSDDQVGHSFGDRLTNAFQRVFDLGYSNVIAIGNDCMTLRVEDLIGCANALNENHPIIGPTPGGGAYLIGLNKRQFEAKNFKALKWQSQDLLVELISCLRKNNELLLLESLEDTNTPFSFILQYKKAISQQLKALIAYCIGWFTPHSTDFQSETILLTIDAAFQRRGPPSY